MGLETQAHDGESNEEGQVDPNDEFINALE